MTYGFAGRRIFHGDTVCRIGVDPAVTDKGALAKKARIIELHGLVPSLFSVGAAQSRLGAAPVQVGDRLGGFWLCLQGPAN